MTLHAGARGMRFVVFMRELLCVNLPLAPFYTRTTHYPLRRGNCQQKSWKDQSKWRIENDCIRKVDRYTISIRLAYFYFVSPEEWQWFQCVLGCRWTFKLRCLGYTLTPWPSYVFGTKIRWFGRIVDIFQLFVILCMTNVSYEQYLLPFCVPMVKTVSQCI